MDDEALVSRRRFLSRISLALSGLAAAVVSVPIIAYLLSPLSPRRPAMLSRCSCWQTCLV